MDRRPHRSPSSRSMPSLVCLVACLLGGCAAGVFDETSPFAMPTPELASSGGSSSTDAPTTAAAESSTSSGSSAGDEGSSETTHEPPPPVCGDGNLDPGEACDDGNAVEGDGCSAACILCAAVDGPDPGCTGDTGHVIFVAEPANGGSDKHPGTSPQAPVATVNKAIALAGACANTPCDVVVSAGIYGDTVHMVAGVSIYGGYSPDTWERDLDAYPTTLALSLIHISEPTRPY